MELFKHTHDLTEFGMKSGKIELILNMKVGLDPRLDCTVPEQIQALGCIEAYQPEGSSEWYIPFDKDYSIEDLMNKGNPTAGRCGESYLPMLESAMPIEDATALMRVDPIEASSLLQEAYSCVLKLCDGQEAADLRDKIGIALEEWGLLSEQP